MKKEIDILKYAQDIMKALPKGILVTAKADEIVNPMAIAWGSMGIQWNKLIFTVFIRQHRFTKSLIDKNPEFTVNIPIRSFDQNIISYCGRNSGRDVDKVKELGLILENPNVISVPAIKQLPLTLECKVIYKQRQDENSILPEIIPRFYPQDINSIDCSCNKYFHTAYYGEILSSYIVL